MDPSTSFQTHLLWIPTTSGGWPEEGGYNALACHYGLARKYMTKYAGRVPLILKINGKTTIPSDADVLSTLTGSDEDAVALGVDAVGYTLYVGSPSQGEDFLQFQEIREQCDRYNMPGRHVGLSPWSRDRRKGRSRLSLRGRLCRESSGRARS